MRIVVTGGSGRLGRSIVDTLVNNGHDVMNVDSTPSDNGDAAFFRADLTEPGAAHEALGRHRASVAIHAAALTRPFGCPELHTFSSNVSATFNLFQAAVDMRLDGAVYVSSPNSLGYGVPSGWLPEYLPIDEVHPLRPWHAYNLSKQVGEDIVRMFLRQQPSLVAHIVRPCFVVPPEGWTEEPTSPESIRRRLNDPALAAQSLFNYVDARDVADLILALLTATSRGDLKNGETFLASADDALAQESLCDLIPRYFPGTEKLAANLTGSEPAFDASKAKRCLGWQPRRSWRTELHGLDDGGDRGSS